jgi:hypothetical protein
MITLECLGDTLSKINSCGSVSRFTLIHNGAGLTL